MSLLRLLVWGALPTWAAWLALAATPAGATYPGTNGRIVFAGLTIDTDQAIHLMSVNESGGDLRQLTDVPLVGDERPSFTADGNRIAFNRAPDYGDTGCRCDPKDFPPHAWVMNADGSGQAQLAPPIGQIGFPVISADGTKILYESEPGFSLDNPDADPGSVWEMNADGTNPHQLLSDSSLYAAYSPDGTRIVFRRHAGGIAVARADGSDAHVVIGAGDAPDWSPDGKRIAYVKADGTRILIANADGSGTPRPVTGDRFKDDLLDFPRFSPDGTKLLFIDHHAGIPDRNLYVVDVDGSHLRRILDRKAGPDEPTWQPLPATPADAQATAGSVARSSLTGLSARHTSVRVGVRVRAAGTVTIRLRHGSRLVARGARLITRIGSAHVTVRLTSGGRRLLSVTRGHRLTLTATTTFAPIGGKTVSRTTHVRVRA